MADPLHKRIVRAVNDALVARDRAEMRAMDLVLAPFESPKRRRRTPRRRPGAAKRRRA